MVEPRKGPEREPVEIGTMLLQDPTHIHPGVLRPIGLLQQMYLKPCKSLCFGTLGEQHSSLPRLPNSKGDGREGSREYSSSSFSCVYACVFFVFCFGSHSMAGDE